MKVRVDLIIEVSADEDVEKDLVTSLSGHISDALGEYDRGGVCFPDCEIVNGPYVV